MPSGEGKYSKIKSFRDLLAWQNAHKLAVNIYQVTTHFPGEEKYGLISQMRRCSVSISSNIAEGFKRNSSKDKIHYYTIALGSLEEIKSQVYLCRDLNFINEITFNEIENTFNTTSRLLFGLKRKISRVCHILYTFLLHTN